MVSAWMDSPIIPFTKLIKYNVLGKTLEMIQQKQDWCVEAILSVLQAIAERCEKAYESCMTGKEINLRVD